MIEEYINKIIGKWLVVHYDGLFSAWKIETYGEFEVYADNFGYYNNRDTLIEKLRDTEYEAWKVMYDEVVQSHINDLDTYNIKMKFLNEKLKNKQ